MPGAVFIAGIIIAGRINHVARLAAIIGLGPPERDVGNLFKRVELQQAGIIQDSRDRQPFGILDSGGGTWSERIPLSLVELRVEMLCSRNHKHLHSAPKSAAQNREPSQS